MTPIRRLRGGGEAGHASAFVIGAMAAVLAALGLVFDAGGMLITRSTATTLAFEAARAGAQHIDLAVFRTTGERRLDPATATAAAHDYLTAAGATGTAQVEGTEITVTARLPYQAALLPVGARTAEAQATASARAP